MNLLERYLQTIKPLLPTAQKDDIVAELRDTLLSRFEDREAQLGRALSDAEIGDELKQFGHPLDVAAKYFPPQSLIGPSVFPYWWFVIKAVGAGMIIVYAIVAMISIVNGHNLVRSVMQSGWQLTGHLIYLFGIITLLFAILEQIKTRCAEWQQWQPQSLPNLTSSDNDKLLQINRGEVMFEMAFNITFLMFWLKLLPFPTVVWHRGESIDVMLASVWQPFILLIAALTVIEIALGLVKLISPYWTKPRLLVGMVLNVMTIGITLTVMQHETLITAAEPISAGVGTALGNLNRGVHYALYIVIAITAVEVFGLVRRWWRL